MIYKDKIHSFTDIYDAAVGTGMLGISDSGFNQIWHLPTDPTPLTAQGWIDIFATQLNAKAKASVLPVWMMGMLGLFIPVMREIKEMAYQYELDYYFDSNKFCRRFEYKPTLPEESVKRLLTELKKAP